MAWSVSEAEDEVAERRRRYGSACKTGDLPDVLARLFALADGSTLLAPKLLLLDFARLPSFLWPLAILHLAGHVCVDSVKRILIQRRKTRRVCCAPSKWCMSNISPRLFLLYILPFVPESSHE
jgi:hypothetical protein